ncbi:hypothetical protein [Thiomonas intermedia]|uniref:hypothetical protein n=1 Tax=Thiomonas intermedia TaxID=926 RepID=UPI0012AB43AA|nr:hypothetical protein [Thiomonas intermedia]
MSALVVKTTKWAGREQIRNAVLRRRRRRFACAGWPRSCRGSFTSVKQFVQRIDPFATVDSIVEKLRNIWGHAARGGVGSDSRERRRPAGSGYNAQLFTITAWNGFFRVREFSLGN